MRELTYFVAVSLDGYIAGPGGEFDAFLAEGDHMAAIWEHYAGTAPTQLAEAAGLSVENGPFDTVVMGRNTYDVGLPYLPSPYQHLLQIVSTGSPIAPRAVRPSNSRMPTRRRPCARSRRVTAAASGCAAAERSQPS